MGIRIYKSIGYFFPHKSLKLIAVKNYQEIITNILEGEAEYKSMKDSLLQDLSTEKDIIAQMSIDQYNKKFEEDKYYTPFEQVYFSDTYKGILVYTIDQARYKRGDDLIDYYENNGTPNNKIQRLYSNIYPNFGFEYLGGLPKDIENKIEITKKMYLDWHDIKLINAVLNNTAKNPEKLIKDGIFAPKMEDEAFSIFKSMQIFKNDISPVDFYKNSYPAIVTHWS